MATLTIRNIPDEALARFRVQAAQQGRSMEAEARAMIEGRAAEAARPAPLERLARAQALLREAFGGHVPDDLVDDYLADRRANAARGE